MGGEIADDAAAEAFHQDAASDEEDAGDQKAGGAAELIEDIGEEKYEGVDGEQSHSKIDECRGDAARAPGDGGGGEERVPEVAERVVVGPDGIFPDVEVGENDEGGNDGDDGDQSLAAMPEQGDGEGKDAEENPIGGDEKPGQRCGVTVVVVELGMGNGVQGQEGEEEDDGGGGSEGDGEEFAGGAGGVEEEEDGGGSGEAEDEGIAAIAGGVEGPLGDDGGGDEEKGDGLLDGIAEQGPSGDGAEGPEDNGAGPVSVQVEGLADDGDGGGAGEGGDGVEGGGEIGEAWGGGGSGEVEESDEGEGEGHAGDGAGGFPMGGEEQDDAGEDEGGSEGEQEFDLPVETVGGAVFEFVGADAVCGGGVDESGG